MTKIEKIRQEIERLKKICKDNITTSKSGCFPYVMEMTGYDKILAFIDSLPEEKPSEDLEEVAARYERENRQSILSSVDIVDAFIAGAEWQALQLLKGSPLPEDTVLFQKGVEEGKRLMMEDAVDGEIVKDINNMLAVTAKNINLDGFKFGDKVKIIIVKQ